MPRSNMSPEMSVKNTGKVVTGLCFDGSNLSNSNQGRFEHPESFVPGPQGDVGVNYGDGNTFADPDDDGDWHGIVYGR
jgi:hypothetical protein